MRDVSTALTIAGSDSGGGAGIEADLKTFTVFNVFGTAALTSITAQNTLEVSGIHDIPTDMINKQIDAVVQDIGVDAAKTGMLSKQSTIKAVAEKIDNYEIKTVVDPVMVTKRGDKLLKDNAVESMLHDLVPKALLVTPNIREAQMMTGLEIDSLEDMKEAAEEIYDLGPRNVVIKAGKSDDRVVDLFYDGHMFDEMWGEVLLGGKHGSGCTYSAAITANIAKGRNVRESIEIAKSYIDEAIKEGFKLGSGEHPVNHMVLFDKFKKGGE
ncbi:MAG: bifunctional hydroxymethylpyrimidine kinase/phosphomethylpyrimidine kinase [Thermoplasmatota archaeon]